MLRRERCVLGGYDTQTVAVQKKMGKTPQSSPSFWDERLLKRIVFNIGRYVCAAVRAVLSPFLKRKTIVHPKAWVVLRVNAFFFLDCYHYFKVLLYDNDNFGTRLTSERCGAIMETRINVIRLSRKNVCRKWPAWSHVLFRSWY